MAAAGSADAAGVGEWLDRNVASELAGWHAQTHRTQAQVQQATVRAVRGRQQPARSSTLSPCLHVVTAT